MKMKGKKGMMDDLFDFLFTVIAAFFILFFISMALSGGAAKAADKSLERVDEVNSNFILLNYLRAPVGEGKNIVDLILTSGLDLEELKRETSNFFSEEDCLMVVLSPLIELPPEVLQARRGSVPGEEKLEERKVFHCPDKNKAIGFTKVPHLQTEKVELVGPDLNKTKVFLEYNYLG